MMYRIMMIMMCMIWADSAYSQKRGVNNLSNPRMHTTENLGPDFQHLQNAKMSIQTLNYEKAIMHLDNAIAQNPNSAEAYILRAKLKQILGMGTEASQDMMYANKLNPYNADLFGYNGINGQINSLHYNPEAFQEHLNLSQTIKYYENTVNNIDSIDSEIQIREAISYIESGEWELAQEKLDEVLNSDSRSALAYDLTGVIYMQLGNLEDAAKMFEKAVVIDPSFSIAWYNLGMVEKKNKNTESAKIYFDRAIQLENTLTKAYFERAMMSRQMGNRTDAILDYDTIISMTGDKYVEAYINRALVKKSLGDFTGAINDLNTSIEGEPDNAGLYKNRGNLYFLFGMYTEALNDYSKAINLDDEFAEAYFNRALTYIVLLDNIAACSDLKDSESLGFKKSKDYQFYFCVD
jgi:tetratricopeptide (TPR) repeat protein